jgi:N utilization substance protein A
MPVRLSDEARRYIVAFDDITGATATDCVIDEAGDRLVFVVTAGEMGAAIGPGGETVERLEAEVGRDVRLIEDAEDPEDFVANALTPAAVYNVTISENDDTIAYVEVDEADKGVAIGADGQNIALARRLAERHFDVDDVQLT